LPGARRDATILYQKGNKIVCQNDLFPRPNASQQALFMYLFYNGHYLNLIGNKKRTSGSKSKLFGLMHAHTLLMRGEFAS
jgi:hypothetical protein